MGLFTSMNTASTGLTAQRLRMDVISDNIANATTTRTTDGGPFRRSRVVLRPRNDELEFKTRFLPQALWQGTRRGGQGDKDREGHGAPQARLRPEPPRRHENGAARRVRPVPERERGHRDGGHDIGEPRVRGERHGHTELCPDVHEGSRDRKQVAMLPKRLAGSEQGLARRSILNGRGT